MKKTYNILIIDDHQIIIDTFKNALALVEKDLENVIFKTEEAKCCQSAYEKIKKYSKFKKIDLFFLDISLPPSPIHKIFSGEDLGVKIKAYFPKAKIIVCTGFNDNLKLNNILQRINPDAFLVKGDINFQNIITSIKSSLSNETYYSQTIINLLRKRVSTTIVLGDYDIKILQELSNGARMKDLLESIPLSKTGIEKRKRKLRSFFNINSDSDRELVLTAKKKGFI
ncbi:response regulator [Yeosuana marina]|uniref:response regulator n=1 Tax=Yeosuana marina TaxID=1565536 RepID=UPI001422A26E|nr:response regulator [Yeosuana marina]